jgi:hypothetical protein
LLILDAITGREMKAKAYELAVLDRGELIRKEALAFLFFIGNFPPPMIALGFSRSGGIDYF